MYSKSKIKTLGQDVSDTVLVFLVNLKRPSQHLLAQSQQWKH